MKMLVSPHGPRGRIKTRERACALTEAFTHEREIKAAPELIPDTFPAGPFKSVDVKFLDPNCGSGNFLEGALRGKRIGERSCNAGATRVAAPRSYKRARRRSQHGD